jgi:hypothetical protein
VLIVDDILAFPARGLVWIFRELHNAVQQELATEAETITAELSRLYIILETGGITEAEFDAREKKLLDRPQDIREHGAFIEEDEENSKF